MISVEYALILLHPQAAVREDQSKSKVLRSACCCLFQIGNRRSVLV